MSPNRKNVLVGAVVLGSLLTLGWMLIQFGGNLMLPFSPATIQVRLIAERADGISNGSAVLYRGVSVGRIDQISFSPDQLRVIMVALLDKQPPLPANLRGVIRAQGLIGAGAVVILETADAQPNGQLQPDQEIPAKFVGLDFLPPEFASLANELRDTIREFRQTNLVGHLDQQVDKAGKLIDSIQALVGDKTVGDDLKTTLDNVRAVSEKADRIATNLEKFTGNLEKLSTDAGAAVNDARVTINKTQTEVLNVSKQMGDSLQRVSKLLDQFQSIAEKIDKGQGTAGEFVNDKRLYESLVDTSKQMNAAVSDLKRLLEQWEQEGVSVKFK
jgi:phospholipid/cholesterol/gamma-HCH transport system substrate-binding protein